MSNGKRGAEARPVAKSRGLVTARADATTQDSIGDAAGAASEAGIFRSAEAADTSKTGNLSEVGNTSDVREVADVDHVADAGATTAQVTGVPATLPAMRNGDDAGGIVLKAARVPRRAPQRRAVPWSAEREAIFLETLGQTCSVKNAVRASGLSSATIYRRRDASDTFRAAWGQALREAYTRLETELLSRALNGVRKPVWHAGKKVGSVVEYSDRLALALLGQYRETCRGSTQTASPQAEARIVLIETLARMNRGMGGEG